MSAKPEDVAFALKVAEAMQLIHPIANAMEDLPFDVKIALLMALAGQEICLLPPPQRAEQTERVVREFPEIVAATEEVMRQCLAANARRQ